MSRWVSRAVWCAVSLGLAHPAAAQTPDATPRIILFIGDGVGVSYWSAAAFAADRLAVHEFPVVGLVDVRASDSKVTDSAAGATAYAAGVRTYNGAIGVGPDTTPVRTVLELAAQRGMATGLVATSSVTHATPAAFAAHVTDRSMEWEIAKQITARPPTVLLGGGRRFFDPTQRSDAADLLKDLRRGRAYVESPDDLAGLRFDSVAALVGLFAVGQMTAAVRPEVTLLTDPAGAHPPDTSTRGSPVADTSWVRWRSPTLPEMTRAALAVLDRDPDGFFLMVEASQPDWRGHGNEPLAAVTAEMLDFDGAVREAIAYQETHPETLILIVADHETGGFTVQLDASGNLTGGYTTTSHTGEWVPLFARGPGAERFGGVQDNHVIGRLLLALVGGG